MLPKEMKTADRKLSYNNFKHFILQFNYVIEKYDILFWLCIALDYFLQLICFYKTIYIAIYYVLLIWLAIWIAIA